MAAEAGPDQAESEYHCLPNNSAHSARCSNGFEETLLLVTGSQSANFIGKPARIHLIPFI